MLYLGDYVETMSGALVYLNDICNKEDKLLLLIGTATEIETATQIIPMAAVAAAFERPFDLKKMVAQADGLLSTNMERTKLIAALDDFFEKQKYQKLHATQMS